MPLPLPNLDDRRWADLVQEARAQIPRYAPRWTDHNVHDPGVTFIELFAWMADADLYRLNRVTDRHREKFLSLLGFSPAPPDPAETMLAFEVKSAGPGLPLLLPSGVEFEGKNVQGVAVPFRTLRAITISHVALLSMQSESGGILIDLTREWVNGLPIHPFGREPQPGATFYIGFAKVPTNVPVTLAFRWDRPGADAAGRSVQSADERAALVAERAAQRRACRPILPDINCPDAKPSAQPSLTTPPHHSVRLVWEAFTGTWTRLQPVAAPSSPAAGQIADDTRALTLDGLVEINLPAGISTTPVGSTSAFYLRCRIESGSYDAPPVMLDVFPNAVPAEQAIPLWQRLTIPAAVNPSTPPAAGTTTRFRAQFSGMDSLLALAFDPTAAGLPDVMVLEYQKPVTANGFITVEMVRIGTGTGRPEQDIILPAHAIASDDALAVYSHDGVTWQRWEIRPDFDASTRVDWHCTLDRTSGVLMFGDGERGRVVPKDHAVLVTARATLGGAGAVAPRSVNGVRKTPKNTLLLTPAQITLVVTLATNPWPSAGGTDRESLSHAAGRAAETLHAHDRLLNLAHEAQAHTFDQVDRREVRELPAPSNGVNLLDLERLALDVPGTRVARARAWANVRAQYPCLVAPGSVTLVVIPDMPTARPQPSAGLLRTVKRYLDRRRMVATVLQVVGPKYLVVSVNAKVQSQRGAKPANVNDRIVRALNAFLDPRSGGPNNLGWPFGRDVYRAEIMQLIDGVAGVDHVLDLSLSAPGTAPQCGNLRVCPTWLAAPGEHRIEVV